jgi:phage anti-repressor protein
MTTQLIPVFTGQIQGQPVQLVNARRLHEFLGVGRDFSNWIKDRIDEYGFVKDSDYLVFFAKIGENSKRGRPTTDYHLTLDTAKELSMVERTDKGREARRYFIAMEQRALEGSAAPAKSLLPHQGKAIVVGKYRIPAQGESCVDDWQYTALCQAIRKRVETLVGHRQPLYQAIITRCHQKLKDRFGCSGSLRNLLAFEFDTAMRYIEIMAIEGEWLKTPTERLREEIRAQRATAALPPATRTPHTAELQALLQLLKAHADTAVAHQTPTDSVYVAGLVSAAAVLVDRLALEVCHG